jgi:hypothetical protein
MEILRVNIAPICMGRASGSNKKTASPDCNLGEAAGEARGVYSIVKAMMLLPRLESIWALPPEPTTTYCLPSTM